MTVLDLLRLTRANIVLIFVCGSLGLIAMFLYTVRQPVLYTASATGYVVVGAATNSGEAMSNATLASSRAAVYTSLVTTTEVARRVVADLGLEVPPEAIATRFSAVVAAPDNTRLIISANGSTPDEARDLANSVVKALAAQVTDYENAGRAEGQPISTLIQLRPAEQALLPSAPSSPVYGRNLLMGTAVGVGIGFGIGLLRRSVDRRLRDVADVEEASGTSVMGIIPRVEALGDENRGTRSDLGRAAEAFRQLRTNLRFVDVDRPPRSIVITSPNAGEGKSTVSANLARVIAASGQRVLLVDADLRRPTLADTYRLDSKVGLTQVLAGEVGVGEVIQESPFPNLQLIAAGRIPPNPSELLGSQRMHALVDELTREYLVLFDAPPLLPVTDSGLLSATCDGALLVCAINSTYREQVQLSRRVLDHVSARLLGAVVNRAPVRGMGSVVYGYGYGDYKQDYESREKYERKGGARRSEKAER